MALGAIAVIVIVGITVIGACAVYAHKTRVQGVADLAALAGGKEAAVSTVLAEEHNAALAKDESTEASCEIARQVAQRNDMSLEECFVRKGDVYVHLRSAHELGGIHAYARAGAALPLSQ